MAKKVLRIALISPHAWPPRDDVAHHVAAEAAALARRGHRVTVLAPATRRDLIAAGRALLVAAHSGDPDALSPSPGHVLEVAVGRAVPAGPGRRVGEPFDLAATLETVLSRVPFDIVHLHEPLAPTPALAALRHAPGVTVATFHRAEPLAGVAFLRPLVDRALARADLRIATTEAGRAALSEILPGDYAVIPPGVDAGLFHPGSAEEPPGLALVARGRDRVGVRFALGVLRALDPSTYGDVTLIGPADAPWRTRAAVPKALRERVRVAPDAGPDARAAVLAGAALALFAAPADAAGPVLREAMASGCAVLVPGGGGKDVHDTENGLVLPAFTREAWTAAVEDLLLQPARRRMLGEAALTDRGGRTWDHVAAELESAYVAALTATPRRAEPASPITADLRVRPGRGTSADALVAACLERGVDVVAVASPAGLGPARAVAAAAPPGLTVIVGQEIATDDGALVGLFLTHPVADGVTPAEAAAAVHAQGGLVMVPHAEAGPPSPEGLRSIAGAIDLHETATGGARSADGVDDALRRLGLLPCAGSGATRAHEIASVVTRLPRFDGPEGLLAALADAELVAWGRGGTTHGPGSRGRRRRSPTT